MAMEEEDEEEYEYEEEGWSDGAIEEGEEGEEADSGEGGSDSEGAPRPASPLSLGSLPPRDRCGARPRLPWAQATASPSPRTESRPARTTMAGRRRLPLGRRRLSGSRPSGGQSRAAAVRRASAGAGGARSSTRRSVHLSRCRPPRCTIGEAGGRCSLACFVRRVGGGDCERGEREEGEGEGETEHLFM